MTANRILSLIFRMLRLLILLASSLPISLTGYVIDAQAQTGPSGPSQSAVVVLKPGDSITRELSGGGDHSYQLDLSAHQFAQFVVEQEGIDVVLTLSRSDDIRKTRVDRPNGSRGRETLSIITPTAGIYLLNIVSLESVSAKGQYHLYVAPLRAPAAWDTDWISAEQAVSEGEVLRSAGTSASFLRAIAAFDKAAELWHALQQPYEEALALYGSGISATAVAENQRAIEYFNRGLTLFNHDLHGEAITRAALGWPYMYLGDNVDALENFSLGLKLYKSENNIRGEGVTLYGIGWVRALQGHYDEALTCFSESLDCRREAKDRRGEALTLTGMGKVLARNGNRERAIDSLKEAREVLGSRDHYAEADILSNLGWVYSTGNDIRTAVDYFERALPLRQMVGDRIGEATTLFGLSEAHHKTGNLSQAESEIAQAVGIIEKLRDRGLNQQLRISYFASIQEYYDFYIQLMMELEKLKPFSGYAARALDVSERSRARGLIDLLSEAQFNLRQGIESSLLQEERTTGLMLNAAAARRDFLLTGRPAPTELQQVTDEIRELAGRAEELKARIRAANPRFAGLTRPEPLTSDQIQRELLDGETLLLEYSLGEKHSYCWAVSSHELSSYELAAGSIIERIARRAYESLTARNLNVAGETFAARRQRISRADLEANEALHELSRLLLVPVAQKLGRKRLVIVAPGALQLIPFAALSAPAPLKNSAADGVLKDRIKPVLAGPLLAEHEIVTLPSATTLSLLRREHHSHNMPTKGVAVFADPVYSASDGRVKKNTAREYENSLEAGRKSAGKPDEGVSELPRLTSSRWEATKIANSFGGENRVFVDFDASRKEFFESQAGTYRFLHFATHAVIDNEHPQLSGIVLSMVDEQGRPVDGFLRSNEIFGLSLSADLVVLSACRTASGKDFKGEGLVGLTRGFMYAGAPRVVASLWNVDDKPTSELMVRFYRHMLGPEKLPPAAALRAAQLEFWKDPRWKSPFFWAPFIIQGEWR